MEFIKMVYEIVEVFYIEVFEKRLNGDGFQIFV